MALNTTLATSLLSVPFSTFIKKFRPLPGKVALRRHAKDDKAAPGSSLFRPATKQKNSDRATVVAFGPDCRVMKAEGVKVGDVVLVSTFADGDRDVGGERLMILPESEIMGVEEG